VADDTPGYESHDAGTPAGVPDRRAIAEHPSIEEPLVEFNFGQTQHLHQFLAERFGRLPSCVHREGTVAAPLLAPLSGCCGQGTVTGGFRPPQADSTPG
jgi:hypothetical protein